MSSCPITSSQEPSSGRRAFSSSTGTRTGSTTRAAGTSPAAISSSARAPQTRLARELREEIGVDATITGAPALRVVENEGADDGLVLQLWFVTEWEGEPTNLATDEHDELRWVAVRDVSALDLAHPSYLMFLTEWADGIGANVPPPASTPGPRPGRITP